MKKIISLLVLLLGLALWACTLDRPSIAHSSWVYQDPTRTLTLYFSDQTCQTTIMLAGVADQQAVNTYSYLPPKIVFTMADGTQAVGVFYDDYTRLEVVNQSVEYTFMRTN